MALRIKYQSYTSGGISANMPQVSVTQKFLLSHCFGVAQYLKWQRALGTEHGLPSCRSGLRCSIALIYPVVLVNHIAHHFYLFLKILFIDLGGGVDLLSYLFLHSLVESCICPDTVLSPQPWCIRITL